MPEDTMPKDDVGVLELISLARWFKKHEKKMPLYSVGVVTEQMRDFGRYWHKRKDGGDNQRDISNAIQQLLETLFDMPETKQHDAIDGIRAFYIPSYGTSGGVSGTNEYHSDKSRVDGKLIRRKR